MQPELSVFPSRVDGIVPWGCDLILHRFELLPVRTSDTLCFEIAHATITFRVMT